ncbi:hypothetical protein [Paramagnetospirillum magneticum]|uniref:Uncharacterized protein n=1 Tax=Paramagnetospirillum magneticum (strain ATCC 700264 / AMB-1) TaxID=342108 RepID=Q2W6M9_PARM1|nr:hypothetical protein [Paramagnetospirillum magneticum]BAE50496.1 hypothetical protein amb1692 [Paramagnetospirillum magneticum AMB-1]
MRSPPPEVRKKPRRDFIKFEVQPEEREEYEAIAMAADMTLSALIRKALSSVRIVNRHDWARQASLLCQCANQLQEICRMAETKLDTKGYIDVVQVLISLDRSISSVVNVDRGTK